MTAQAPYRLPDAAFWAFVVASAAFCAAHALRRWKRAPTPRGPVPLTPRHSAFQRFFHWANAVAVAILLGSGLAIYAPQGLGGGEPATAFWFAWHLWVAPAFAALVVAHVIHELRAPEHVDTMWPSRRRGDKFDRAQILYHWTVAANLAGLVLTGAVLWRPLRTLLPLRLLGLGWDFVFLNRILHGALTATLLALVLAHVYFALLVRENIPRARSMVLGRPRNS